MEAVILIDVLRRAGASVVVASVEPELNIEASGGTRLVADTYISNCSNEVFDLVALPVSVSKCLLDSSITRTCLSSSVLPFISRNIASPVAVSQKQTSSF